MENQSHPGKKFPSETRISRTGQRKNLGTSKVTMKNINKGISYAEVHADKVLRPWRNNVFMLNVSALVKLSITFIIQELYDRATYDYNLKNNMLNHCLIVKCTHVK